MIHAREDYNRIQDPDGKIGEDEPVFLLRAKDKYFVRTVQYYASLVEKDPQTDPRVVQTIWNFLRERVFQWRKAHSLEIHAPDLPREGELK